MLDKLLEFFLILLPILFILIGIIRFETNCQELERTLLGANHRILQSPIPELRQHPHHNIAQMMLQERRTIAPLRNLLQFIFAIKLDW